MIYITNESSPNRLVNPKAEDKNPYLIGLSREIEFLRKILNQQIDNENSLLDIEVYETSKKLDELIVKYKDLRNQEKREKNEEGREETS